MTATKTTTKPHILTVPELFALADQALAMERPVRGVDRYWLVAVALVESGGDPRAVGDDGHAHGLHQFHLPAWVDCWGDDWPKYERWNPLDSFRAAIRYARQTKHGYSAGNIKGWRSCHSSHHHNGHFDANDKKYINRVERRYQTLVKEHGGK